MRRTALVGLPQERFSVLWGRRVRALPGQEGER